MTRYVIDAPISDMTSDSRLVEKNSLFMAYPGSHGDGRNYIAQAIENGAIAVMWEQENFVWDEHWQVQNLAIPNLSMHAGYIASQFYKNPSAQLWSIGVTGTNGKTSVSHWVAQAFDYLKRKSAVVGTLGNGFLDGLTETLNTTPGAIALQRMLATYVQQNAQVVAMEVSSHGLDQGRLLGMEFDVAILTNVTRDHLDYHKTMKAYQDAKKKLFLWQGLKASVINHDDAFGRTLLNELNRRRQRTLSYGIKSGDVRATKVTLSEDGFTSYIVTPYGSADVRVNLIGEFNVYNVLAVLATLLVSDVAFSDAIEAISQLTPVMGRMQTLGGGDKPMVVVDYAHTPDALDKVLQTLTMLTKAKLICVFGCGGDRDVGKRFKMGKVVSQYAHKAIVTTDNPRSEEPKLIIDQIVKGMDGQYIVEADRAKAIALGVSTAKPGDVVLVAGKGHEDYQEVKGVKHFFSDVEQVRLALEQYEGAQA
jgi:UDP-N-acetylmuramoyl-L-alanyl-D-glutamate--2,6-diaminopimelate ligase